jgi:glycerophosphoryl diester phosphodiesterase
MSPAPALQLEGKPRPWIMAHRGASELGPENSLASFALALEHGADLLETDLWFSADGEIVCHHDTTLKRMTGDPRRVDQVGARELGRLKMTAGHGVDRHPPQTIPTLAELLSIVPDDVPVVLELKDPRFEEPDRARQLVATLGDRVQNRRAGVITDRLARLAAVKRAADSLVTGYIAMARLSGPRWTDMLGPYWPLLRLNPRYVRTAHRRGQRVCPLDPDLHRRLPRYLALDVDAVLTNDPAGTRARIDALRS